MTLTSIEDIVHQTLRADNGITLPPPPWAEIGHGVWGTVYDLGDGTILKLVRKRGGLGSPAALIAREAEALRALGGKRVGGFHVPELISHGDLNLPSNPFVAPLEGYLRMAKLSGVPLGRALPASPEIRQRLCEQLGAALSDFHEDASILVDMDKALFTDPIVRAANQLQNALRKPEDQALAKQLATLLETQSGQRRTFLHGDFHISNVLVASDGTFGLVDFAEAGIGAAHTEFRHFEERPELRDVVFLGYQTASGAPVDLDLYYLSATVNALAALHFGGTAQPGVAANDPRVAVRLRGMVRHCAKRADLTYQDVVEG